MKGFMALLVGALLILGGQAVAGEKQKVIYHINGGVAQLSILQVQGYTYIKP